MSFSKDEIEVLILLVEVASQDQQYSSVVSILEEIRDKLASLLRVDAG